MQLQQLRLQAFRAHTNTQIDLAPKVNLLYGPNGAGKTNVLEGIHYLGLTKSFVASRDKYVVQQGQDFFEVEGTFKPDERMTLTVRLVYVPGEGKQIFVNKSPLDRISDLVGKVPIVVFAPSDYAITRGGPQKRRDFVNNVLSQGHPIYLRELQKYQRIVKQRNALLRTYQDPTERFNKEALESWNHRLIETGARIISYRTRFLEEFRTYLHQAYQEMDAVGEEPSISYQTIASFGGESDENRIAEQFETKVREKDKRERERGVTLLGPHRDEFVFRLNDLKVRQYASQGQHRTFGMALKLAKYHYLADELNETPLLLLDDVFGDLDSHRTAVLLNLLQSNAVGQSILTAVEHRSFTAEIDFSLDQHQLLGVRSGTVEVVDDLEPERH